MNDNESLDPQGNNEKPVDRPPRTLRETLLANFRPQPAIPALFVLIISILVPAISHDPGAASSEGDSALLLLIPVGIAISCGLAVAAGFCSLFPQLAWIAVAVWTLGLTESGRLPAYNRWVLLAGIVVTAVMFAVQIWRVRTGRFCPSIRIRNGDEY